MRCGSGFLALRLLPPAVHPKPLLGVAQHEALERRVVRTCCEPYLLASIVALDRSHGLFEAEHVRSVGFAPACCRKHRRSCGQGDDRQALERPRRMSEKIHTYSVRRARMLIEGEYNHVARLEPLEDGVE